MLVAREIRVLLFPLSVSAALACGCAGRVSDPASALAGILDAQAEAWNQGDIEGFMRPYWRSEELTFSAGGTTHRGFERTLARYRMRYPTPERMGRLSFSELEVRRLGGDAALVLGRWRLERDPDPIGGNFSLVFERRRGRWVIVHDHTSADPSAAD